MPGIAESLEDRTLLTDLSGTITTDMSFTDASDQINIVGDVFVRNGAKLTFGAGVVVVEGHPFHDIFVSDDGSAAQLNADGATFQVDVVLRPGAAGSLMNNTFDRTLTIDGDQSSALVISGNAINVTPLVHPEFIPKFTNNTFPAGATIGITLGDVNVNTNWPVVSNVSQYRLFGDVRVRNGAALTVASGVTVQEDSSFHDVFVGDDGSAARLTASNVVFSTDVVLRASATGSLSNNTFHRTLTIDGGESSSLVVTGNSINVTPLVHPEYIPRLGNNTFPAGSIVGITTGDVTVDTSWPVISNVSQYRLFGDVRVRNGAALTVASGLAVQEDSSFHDLFVGDDGSAARLTADSATFVLDVMLRTNATGSLTNNIFNRTLTVDGEETSSLIVSDNTINVTPLIHPEYIPRIRDNTFPPASIVGITAGDVTVDTVWRVIPNVSQYRLFGDVRVLNGAQLVVPDGLTIQEDSSFHDLFIGGSGSGGKLLARDVVIIAEVIVNSGSSVDLSWVEHRRDLTLNANTQGIIDRGILTSSTLLMAGTSTVEVSNTSLASGTVEALRDSGATIDLTGNWWGTTNPATMEQKTLHQPDDARRPLVVFDPFLTSAPLMPVKPDPGFTIFETSGATIVNETGTSDTFSVLLNAQPLVDVVLEIESADTSEVITQVNTLRFTRENWNQLQSVQVTGVDDPAVDGTQQTSVTVSVLVGQSDDAFESVAPQSVSVSTLDDDVAGLFVEESAGSTVVAESGTTDGFTARLIAQPLTDVVIQVVSSDLSEMTVLPEFLTFTPSDWSLVKVVTVTGVDDGLADGSQQSVLTFRVVDAQSHDAFDSLPDQTFTVVTQDDDLGFTVAETGTDTTVSESGGQDSFTVVLNGEPLGDVVISISSDNDLEVSPETNELTFTPTNWNVPQSVIVTGVDDAAVDGPSTTDIRIGVRNDMSHEAFHDLPEQRVSVVNTDDEIAGFLVSESNGATVVSEAGTTDTFTVVLTALPVSDVVFDVTLPLNPDVGINRPFLTFTPANWDVPQTVTVTGLNDDIDDGDTQTLVTISVRDTASSAPFALLPDQTVAVTVTDNDVRGVSVSAISGDTTEAGGTATFTIVLDSQPTAPVTIGLVSSNANEGSVSPSSVTFTAGNWNQPQTVTVTGVDDNIDDGDTGYGIMTEAAVGGDYQGLNPNDVAVINLDDDTAGFHVSKSTARVSEDGSTLTDSFSVVLDTQPVSDVVLELTLSSSTEAAIDKTSITFNATNWNVPQLINITGVDDDVVDGDQSTTITVSVKAADSDDAFDAVAARMIVVTTTDDDFQQGDVDGNATFDANDSFLIHLVQLAGTDNQLDQSKGSSSLTASEIRAAIAALTSSGDVDGDGDFDANDSFLIHLVKLSGTDQQIDQSKGSSSLTATQIRSRVDALGQPPSGNAARSSRRVAMQISEFTSSVISDDSERSNLFESSLSEPVAPAVSISESSDSATVLVWEDFRSWIDAI